MPSSWWSRFIWSPWKSMKGNPMQKPCTAITHGRGPSRWRTTTAEAVRFGSNAIHRSAPGSPG